MYRRITSVAHYFTLLHPGQAITSNSGQLPAFSPMLAPLCLADAWRRRNSPRSTRVSSARSPCCAKRLLSRIEQDRAVDQITLVARAKRLMRTMTVAHRYGAEASDAKTKTSDANTNAFLRHDNAKSPTRDSGERGDKHRSRRAISRQSQDGRQMEGARVHLRRANGPENPRPTLLSREDDVLILAYRWRTRLALNDCQLRLRRLMPKLSRSTLHRCLKRHGLGRIGPTATRPLLTTAALGGPFIFEIAVHEVTFRDPDHGIGVCIQSFSPSKRSRKTFMQRSQTPHLKTPPHFLLAWSINLLKRSLR